MKRCCKCKESFLLSKFYKCTRNNDGLQDICKTCNNKRNRQRYADNPQYYKQSAKERVSKTNEYLFTLKSKPCTDCRQKFHPACMDFDHLYGKEQAISMIRGRSIEKILKEISKCELVCANCHRLRTFKRKLNII